MTAPKKSNKVESVLFDNGEEWYNQSGSTYVCLKVPEGWDEDDFSSVVADALERRGYDVE